MQLSLRHQGDSLGVVIVSREEHQTPFSLYKGRRYLKKLVADLGNSQIIESVLILIHNSVLTQDIMKGKNPGIPCTLMLH